MLVLSNECLVSQAWEPSFLEPQPTMLPFIAIWDTGATNSAVTQDVIDACGLVATGLTTVHHVDGSTDTETYLVNIGLPNKVAFVGVRVTKCKLPGDAKVLIGMDIISQGDFAVTNFGGTTKFSFRVPSGAHIDFVRDKGPQFQHGGTKQTRTKQYNSKPLGRKKSNKKKNR